MIMLNKIVMTFHLQKTTLSLLALMKEATVWRGPHSKIYGNPIVAKDKFQLTISEKLNPEGSESFQQSYV